MSGKGTLSLSAPFSCQPVLPGSFLKRGSWQWREAGVPSFGGKRLVSGGTGSQRDRR